MSLRDELKKRKKIPKDKKFTEVSDPSNVTDGKVPKSLSGYKDHKRIKLQNDPHRSLIAELSGMSHNL